MALKYRFQRKDKSWPWGHSRRQALMMPEAWEILHLAHNIRGICGQIFRYAVATGRAERDPSAALRGSLPPVKTINRAAITDPVKVGKLLRAIDGYQEALLFNVL